MCGKAAPDSALASINDVNRGSAPLAPRGL
jgi:hypothetical protein